MNRPYGSANAGRGLFRAAAQAPEHLHERDHAQRARDDQGVDQRELGQAQERVDQEREYEEIAAAQTVDEDHRAVALGVEARLHVVTPGDAPADLDDFPAFALPPDLA